MLSHDIVNYLLKYDFQITPDGIKFLMEQDNDVHVIIDKIIQQKTKNKENDYVISKYDIENIVIPKKKIKVVKDMIYDFQIVSGQESVPDQLEGIDGYHRLINNRFGKFSRIMHERQDSKFVRKINVARNNIDGKPCKIAGLLVEKNKREKTYDIIIEDDTGSLNIMVIGKSAISQIERFLIDQMIIIDISYSKKINRFVLQDCYPLDIPSRVFDSKEKEPVYGVFLSDIHVGSKTFLEDSFKRFLDWLNGKSDDLETVNNIQYLVVAGDVVDGIGVYPGQEEELTELNFTKQYDEFAKLLKEIPNHIRVFISPGNHDATRHALPQPPIFKKYASSLYDMDNVEMLGDPCYIRLHGVNILVYHGQSLPDIIGSTPGISFDNPAEAMKVLLRARHLSPTHGSGSTTVALEEDDRLVIDDVPDIFHCGHVHTVQAMKYRGSLLINSGTWQSQTQYQKRLGIVPEPAVAMVVDLSTLEMVMMKRFE